MLANITPVKQRVALGRKVRVATLLDVEQRSAALTDRLELDAYGCAEVVFD